METGNYCKTIETLHENLKFISKVSTRFKYMKCIWNKYWKRRTQEILGIHVKYMQKLSAKALAACRIQKMKHLQSFSGRTFSDLNILSVLYRISRYNKLKCTEKQFQPYWYKRCFSLLNIFESKTNWRTFHGGSFLWNVWLSRLKPLGGIQDIKANHCVIRILSFYQWSMRAIFKLRVNLFSSSYYT